MKVSYRHFQTGATIHEDRLPLEHWVYHATTGDYLGRFLSISGGNITLRMYSMYLFCCGLREIGSIHISYGADVEKIRNEFLQLLKTGEYYNIGALTYTRTKDGTDFELQTKEVIEFIEKWPGASAGGWFYNPNSGNMVQQWTLPVNQGRIPDSYSEEEDDE